MTEISDQPKVAPAPVEKQPPAPAPAPVKNFYRRQNPEFWMLARNFLGFCENLTSFDNFIMFTLLYCL